LALFEQAPNNEPLFTRLQLFAVMNSIEQHQDFVEDGIDGACEARCHGIRANRWNEQLRLGIG
jgi:hypothetical protein